MAGVPGYFYTQSAVIPCRLRKGRIEVLLITSRRRKRWIIPKGVVEPGLGARRSAAKEALEEAGIEGYVEQDALGAYTYGKWGGTCTVQVFVMHVRIVHGEWEEDFRERAWVPLDDAKKNIKNKKLKNCFDKLPEILASSRFPA